MTTNNQNKNNNKNQKQNKEQNYNMPFENKNFTQKVEEKKEDKNILVLALVWIIALLFWLLAITIYTAPKPVPLINQVNNLYNKNQDSWEEIKEIKAVLDWKYRK